MTALRKVEKLLYGSWIEVRLKDLRKGDIFRMFEGDGEQEPVMDINNDIIFIASSDPYKVEYEGEEIWGIECTLPEKDNEV